MASMTPKHVTVKAELILYDVLHREMLSRLLLDEMAGELESGAIESDPATWPDWTDSWHYEPNVLPDDAEWASQSFGADADDYTVLDVEHEAAESAAVDCLGRGLIPADVAERIALRSQVGHCETP